MDAMLIVDTLVTPVTSVAVLIQINLPFTGCSWSTTPTPVGSAEKKKGKK